MPVSVLGWPPWVLENSKQAEARRVSQEGAVCPSTEGECQESFGESFVALICTSLTAHYVDHLFVCMFAIVYLVTCLLRSLAHF